MGKNPIAVLIDGENVPASHIAAIMQKARDLGDPIARCVVGDFSAGKLSGWAEIASQCAFETIFQISSGAGKNSTDIALTIRAMDLLAEKRFGCFLIVSSDRDFAPLALRLRRSGVPVYGMGASTPGSAWLNACTEYFKLCAESPAKPNGNTNAKAAPAKKVEPSAKPPVSQEDREAVQAILGKVAATGSNWIKLSQLGQHVREASKALGARLSKGRLLKNLHADPRIELRGKGQGIEVRLRKLQQPKQSPKLFTPPRPSPAEARPPM